MGTLGGRQPTRAHSHREAECGDPARASHYLPDTNGVMGYNWRSAHYFAQPPTTDIGYPGGDLSIQKFKTMPILILHGDIDFGVTTNLGPEVNPVPLAHPAAISPDIAATNIFVGPNNPAFQPCTSTVAQTCIPTSVLCVPDPPVRSGGRSSISSPSSQRRWRHARLRSRP
jgi:hypothetical protein